MANTITGGTIATPGTGVHTLAALITRARVVLHDKVEPYLWENSDLTDCYNELLRAVTREIPAIEDRTTSAICTYTYLINATTIPVHAAIRNIERAKIAAETSYLEMVSRGYMDVYYSDWENATSATPTTLITSGLGMNIVRLYPPALIAGTLNLDITRTPLVDAVYDTDSATETAFGIDDDILIHGIVARAYMMGDNDGGDHEKAAIHERLFQEAKENYKRAQLRKNSMQHTSIPHDGMM